MAKRILVAVFWTVYFCGLGNISAQPLHWQLMGPGDADQVTSLSVLPDGTVFLGTDIGGIYRSTTGGNVWEPVNTGLTNYHVCTPVIHCSDDPRILYVGTRGGFFKSEDGGLTWMAKRAGLPAVSPSMLTFPVGCVLEDGGDLYIGHGYRGSAELSGVMQKVIWTGSVYTSSDRGETWKRRGVVDDGAILYGLAATKAGPKRLFAATSRGVYASNDAGANWTRIFDRPSLGLAVTSCEAYVLFAACGDGGVFRSVDGGLTWRPINDGLGFKVHQSGNDRYCGIGFARGDENVLYVINSTWGECGGVYRSDNAGGRWSKISENLPESWLKTSRRFNAFAVDQSGRKAKVYIGSSRYVYSSEDAGLNWKQLISDKTGSGWTTTGLNVFGDTRVGAVHPSSPQHLYIGTSDHGLVKSDDGGCSWYPAVAGLSFRDSVWDIAFGGDRIYLVNLKGLKACKVSFSTDKGMSWRESTATFGDSLLYKLAVDRKNSSVVYVCGSGGIFRSVDGALTFKPVTSASLSRQRVHCISIDDNDSAVLFAGTDAGLFKSTDAGSVWERLFSAPGVSVKSFQRSRTDRNTLFIGTRERLPGTGSVYMSADGGITWQKTLSTGGTAWVSGIVQLFSDPNVFYASTNDENYHDESCGAGVYRSRDGGKTWSGMNKGLPVLRGAGMSVSPAQPGKVYWCASGGGMYVIAE